MRKFFLLLLSLTFVSIADDDIKLIKSGDTLLAVKKVNIEKKLKDELESLKKSNIELKKEKKAMIKEKEKIENELKKYKDSYLIIYKISPSLFILTKECFVKNIRDDIVEKWNKDRKFTSYLIDNRDRYRVSGIIDSKGWKENIVDLWIDRSCIKKLK